MPGAGQSPVSPAVSPAVNPDVSPDVPFGSPRQGLSLAPRGGNALMPWIQVLQLGVFVGMSNGR